jgi:hypothetical protein
MRKSLEYFFHIPYNFTVDGTGIWVTQTQNIISFVKLLWLWQLSSTSSSSIITGTTALCELWPSSGFLNNLVFTVWGCQPNAQPPTWRTSVSLFVWLLPLDLSGLDAPNSSYATAAGVALRVSGALKPHHHDKVGIVGNYAFRFFAITTSRQVDVVDLPLVPEICGFDMQQTRHFRCNFPAL